MSRSVKFDAADHQLFALLEASVIAPVGGDDGQTAVME
jgi:hypothetical protein